MESLLKKKPEKCGFDACGVVPVDVYPERGSGWSDGSDKDFMQE